MFQSILVPIDIAHESSWKAAIPEAIELAKANGGRLCIMTVVRDSTSMFEGVYLAFELEKIVSDAKNKLATVVGRYETCDLEIDQVVGYGSIAREILDEAEHRDVDLIVMASHRPEIKDYIIGPNAAHVARHATSSVLVLRT